MSQIPWTRFYPLVLSQVPLCPKPMAKKAIRDSAIEFCERTFVWTDRQEYPVGVDAEYDLQFDAVSVVHRIDSARIVDGHELDIVTPERADEVSPGWNTGELTGGQPDLLTQTRPGSFVLIPAPSTDSILSLAVALKPAKASTYTDSMLFDEYEEAIVSGALARLMGMAGKPWANPAAATYAAVFNDRVVSANLRRAKGFGRAPIRVRGQFL